MKIQVCLLSHTKNHWDMFPQVVSLGQEDHLCDAAGGDAMDRILVSPLCHPSLRHRWKPELEWLT